MKYLPLSTATTLGSPAHFWLGLRLGKPIRSVKDCAPFRENPTPVPEACGSVLGCMKKELASFQASMTSFPEAAIAVSLWPGATSSLGFAASTFVPAEAGIAGGCQKGAFGVAKDIGTEVAAKVIAKSIGLEP